MAFCGETATASYRGDTLSNPNFVQPLDALPVFYDDRMVADIESFSPSAGKPLAALASWQCLGIPLQVRIPDPVTREQLILSHDIAYVDGVLNGALRNGFGNTHPAVTASLPWTTGAMLSAAREAMANQRVAVAPCSGFHHAGYAVGGGFCTFNGLMVTALALLHEGNAARIGILDCDQHYGDGTDDIRRELGVITQIPHYSAGSKCRKSSEAKSFLRQLPKVIESFTGCDVLLYQAGADPHVDDPLGGWLTTEEIAERDRIVFDTAAKLRLPVAWNLAGGYQTPLRRVLDIHDNTLRACAAIYLTDEVGQDLARKRDTVTDDTSRGEKNTAKRNGLKGSGKSLKEQTLSSVAGRLSPRQRRAVPTPVVRPAAGLPIGLRFR